MAVPRVIPALRFERPPASEKDSYRERKRLPSGATAADDSELGADGIEGLAWILVALDEAHTRGLVEEAEVILLSGSCPLRDRVAELDAA